VGRPYKIIMDQGPIGEFAQALRDYHEAVDLERSRRLTYREMAKIGQFSHSRYASATNGRTLPTQALVEDYVRVLGASEYEVLQWKKRRVAVYNELTAAAKRMADAQSGPNLDSGYVSHSGKVEVDTRSSSRHVEVDDTEVLLSPSVSDASSGGVWSH
jgi:hypothetical protein